MRFFIINSDYEDFVEKDILENPGILNKNFDEQLQHRYDTLFGVSNFYSKNIKLLGHEAVDIIINHKYIQKQWAVENNITLNKSRFQYVPFIRKYFKENWIESILEAQIIKYKPDIIYTMTMDSLSSNFLNKIKSKVKNIKIIGQHAAKITPLMSDLSAYDIVLSSLPNQVEYFKKCGVKSFYFPLGFESTVIEKTSLNKDKYELTHIGGYGQIHNERNNLLEQVAKSIKLDTWGYGIENLSVNSTILKNFHGEIWGLDMYNILTNSKITITKHIDSVAGKHANNMTLYEATGCGCLLMVDKKENIGDLFIEGKEIVTYSNSDELIEKIKFYLNNENDRIKIARAGQERTLKDHTYLKRMQELIKIINENE